MFLAPTLIYILVAVLGVVAIIIALRQGIDAVVDGVEESWRCGHFAF